MIHCYQTSRYILFGLQPNCYFSVSRYRRDEESEQEELIVGEICDKFSDPFIPRIKVLSVYSF
jgi:hypothetical protein